jgi:hypothetical protein
MATAKPRFGKFGLKRQCLAKGRDCVVIAFELDKDIAAAKPCFGKTGLCN